MKLAKKTEYALQALAEMAMRAGDAGDEPIQVRELARRQSIPAKFLEQIMVTLKNGGLVESRRGCNGGYVLRRTAREISLGQVIRLFEGGPAPLETNGDAADSPEERARPCRDLLTCGVRDILRDVEQALTVMLDGLSLQDVCRRSRELRLRQSSALLYSI